MFRLHDRKGLSFSEQDGTLTRATVPLCTMGQLFSA